MEILWLIAGFVVSVVVIWVYFNAWFKRQLSVREAGWLAACRRIQETVDLERDAHQETNRRLTALEAKHILARDHIATLSAELKSARERLDDERRRLIKTKQLLSQAESDRAAVAEWADALKLELETARYRIAQNGNAVADLDSRLTHLSAVKDNSQNWLKAERLAAVRADTQIGEPVTETEDSAALPVAESAQPQIDDDNDQSQSGNEDLNWIKGMKGKLNQVGITSFRQIAGFPEADIARADESPEPRGRIVRKRRVDSPEELAG